MACLPTIDLSVLRPDLERLHATADQPSASLIEGLLRSPSDANEIGIASVSERGTVNFFRLALNATGLLLTLLHFLSLLAITFRQRRFSWSSDGCLLASFR